MLFVFVLVVLGLRIHRVSVSLEEMLVGSTRVLGLSPSQIVIPLLCAVCVRTRIVCGDVKQS